MNLLVDMGNSRLKWATMTAAETLNVGESLANAQLSRHTLMTTWQAVVSPQQLVIACVGSHDLFACVQAVALALWPAIKIRRLKAQAHAFDVRNAYQQPEKLGIDRWLALVAARHYYPSAVCVVDCGTAITVDLMDAHGQHQGGLISPGLTLMRHALANGTEALPFNAVRYDNLAPANFTEAAVCKGTLSAAVGLIERVITQHAEPYQLILTGGDAATIAPHLRVHAIVDADLVLRGLARVATAPL
jgi:type III pantothenate kinase